MRIKVQYDYLDDRLTLSQAKRKMKCHSGDVGVEIIIFREGGDYADYSDEGNFRLRGYPGEDIDIEIIEKIKKLIQGLVINRRST